MTDSHLDCAPTDVDEALNEAEAVCEARGARLTKIRRKVLSLMLEHREPAKAYDLLQRLDGEGAAKPPTVYRALEFLLEMGLAHKIESLNAYVACGHWGHKHMAVFLICDNCKAISELHADKTHAALDEEVQAAGFDRTSSVMEVHGKCANCAAAA
ncbi:MULTISPECIES: transcriptional repressor [Ponticaulis]|jgi:Fur family zinc uptake transcriptional regulator|uniref:transcriptional repressor n=1 Tax=Ponticaulis TaxID=1123044 RepID=UPI0003B68F5E|nr:MULTISPECIES: transcriptional repressor [Ponticaulis]RPG16689.1 MAG: transcriptional repressor [Hyphomonadaceae bacterium TMED125]HBH89333.1 transcriptional repressor [Hyphomonadaceae bacterium]MAF57011.1 transcriptional repressor [Ponticaulis sp.]MAJ08891.1 transcriptional repressor [Ponticaulis sp.]MBN04093.1 transcriptional repressor [Ponticaulis sp.]|tara:strand:- start:36337 stop:36804 length:468 start_codon:yes stop_codon:yes gene_type:complete